MLPKQLYRVSSAGAGALLMIAPAFVIKALFDFEDAAIARMTRETDAGRMCHLHLWRRNARLGIEAIVVAKQEG